MTYESFRDIWTQSLLASGLPISGPTEETLDTRTLGREYRCALLVAQRRMRPFTVSVTFSWRWDALTTARTTYGDEDALMSLSGLRRRGPPRTTAPWVRVDATLRASLPYGKPLPFPSERTWEEWCAHCLDRFEGDASLIPRRSTRVRGKRTEALAWQGLPGARIGFTEAGDMALDAVELKAWHLITLPVSRDTDQPRKAVGVDRQLDPMFSRMRTAMDAWIELLPRLLPPPPRRTGRTVALA